MKALCAAVVLVALLLAPPESRPVELIGGQATPVRAITLLEAMLIFTLRQERWDNGAPIQIFIYPENSPLQIQFLYDVLGISEYSYNAQVKRALYLGRSAPPKVVNTADEMLAAIHSIPNSIGYAGDALIYNSYTGLVVVRVIR